MMAAVMAFLAGAVLGTSLTVSTVFLIGYTSLAKKDREGGE